MNKHQNAKANNLNIVKYAADVLTQVPAIPQMLAIVDEAQGSQGTKGVDNASFRSFPHPK